MRDTSLDRLSDPFLWARIQGAMLPIDESGRSFARQLGEVTGLAPDDAETLEAEYRRFLYLAALTPAPRQPLGPLRQAWEYHAGFEGYLFDFCPWVLERHLPAVPVSKITAPAYAATRIDYAAEFGAPPPAPFWPAPEPRIDPCAAFAVSAPAQAATGAPAP
ncbi:MAG: hypothetical protein R3D59_13410 [Paracoccaceae bacterium]|nr:hypothetical protein [Maritimibacter sp.]